MVFLSVLYKFCDCEYKCVCRVRLLLHVMEISIVRAWSLTYWHEKWRDGDWHGKGMDPDLLTCTMVEEDWHGKGMEPDLLTCMMVKRRLAW
jgi:hypothetical protein